MAVAKTAPEWLVPGPRSMSCTAGTWRATTSARSRYSTVYFGPEVTFGGVDGMGNYHWAAVGDSKAEPVVKHVKPRKRAK